MIRCQTHDPENNSFDPLYDKAEEILELEMNPERNQCYINCNNVPNQGEGTFPWYACRRDCIDNNPITNHPTSPQIYAQLENMLPPDPNGNCHDSICYYDEEADPEWANNDDHYGKCKFLKNFTKIIRFGKGNYARKNNPKIKNIKRIKAQKKLEEIIVKYNLDEDTFINGLYKQYYNKKLTKKGLPPKLLDNTEDKKIFLINNIDDFEKFLKNRERVVRQDFHLD